MITKPTVLILGAGASAPYGFPTGLELLRLVCLNLQHPETVAFEQLRQIGFHASLVKSFRNDLNHSSKYSVDAFLEHRPEYIPVGKAAIVQTLMPFESQLALFENSEQENDWYKYLFGRLNVSFEKFGENKISIVTYNYDRSLEHFLFTSLQSSYGKTPKECAAELNKIPIIHLHGKMGGLSWQTPNNYRDYNSNPTDADLLHFKDGIKIVYENMDQGPEFQAAFTVLNTAKRIYFLGFGYDETNIKRLKLKEISDELTGKKRILGTARGKTDLERDRIQVALGVAVELGYKDWDILKLLRERAPLD